MSAHRTDGLVQSSLPKPWEEEPSFHDILYEWMQRAPWLGISAAAHALLFFVFLMIPWQMFEGRVEREIQASLDLPEDLEWEDPEPEPEPDLVDPVLPEDVEPVETDDPEDLPEVEDEFQDVSDIESIEDVDFEPNNMKPTLGIGAGWKKPGKYGNRGRGPGGRGKGGLQPEMERGLKWLADHQDPSGKWDCDEFMKHDAANDVCTGPGQPEHDVGVTGLALLAFLGDGNTLSEGKYKENVANGVRWLRDQQDVSTGLIGEKIGHAYMYDHAIAALALTEAYYFSKSPLLERNAQDAISFITRSRNPYGAWRYDSPPTGASDTSVTGWMVFALKAAEDAGLKTDSQAFTDSISWFDEVTDRTTGRCGYDSVGSPSSRVPGVNDNYPTDETECMTAVSLLCRFFLGQQPKEEPLMRKAADLLLAAQPSWDPDGTTNDMYYWYYGSYAMYQMGGRHWTNWNRSMKPAILSSQRMDGAAKGSWDPSGPWGYSGGRVYSTALGVLCMQVYFRYTRLAGAR